MTLEDRLRGRCRPLEEERGDVGCGVYVGTNTGSVLASRDEGETWHEIARHLPTVLSVEVLDRA